MSAVLLALVACTRPEPPSPPVFVRSGLVTAAGEGRTLADGRRFEARAWAPGDRVGGDVAPRVAECTALAEVGLGDLTQLVARGISAPDTALAFDGDGGRLAVGTYLGEILVLDGWTGEVRARRRVAESAIKRVAWSPDGRELYAVEQSVDGLLRALDPETLDDRATFRMADDLESSAPPGPDDVYGLYTLPGAYGLDIGDDGTLVLVGAHGWDAPEGRRNRSRVWRLARTDVGFDVVAAWPEAPADATFLALAAEGGRVAVSVSRSAGGPDPVGIPVGGVAVLDRATLVPTAALRPEPLQPWFDRAFVWEAIGLHGDRTTLGLADGRVWRPDRVRELGTPLLAGDVPIAATLGHLVDAGDVVLAITSGTSIPYSASRPDLQPPEAHPQEDTLFALDPTTLATLWTWRGEEALHGLTVRDRWVAVGVGPKPGHDEPDRYGVLVLDRTRGGSGVERIAASCGTGQPVFFRTAIAPDGRLAVASFPRKAGDAVVGEYRVTLFL
ncbi:MAG: hypothetical protein H6737_07800 [Alphaproteobacteria bacterium]|nr:hypothetical protein [Alphaproteobacteria bacterium]